MIEAHLERAEVLLQQGRNEAARAELMQVLAELMQVLAEAPDHVGALSMLALSLLESEKHDEALQHAMHAIGAAPDEPLPHYALARVYLATEQYAKGHETADRVIQLAPEWVAARAVKASLFLKQSKWTEVVRYAEEGLQFEPEHEWCLNLRSMALTQLRRHEEADESVLSTLQANPENALAHANRGWSLMHRGEHTGAAEHFREALRLEPDLEWARVGMLEALKAKNVFYRNMLRGLLWLGTLEAHVQVVMMVGAFIGYRFISGLNRSNPELAPVLVPLMFAYFVLVYVTWAYRPISNTALLLHPMGRLALTRREKLGALLTTGLFAGALPAAVLGWLQASSSLLLTGVALALVVIPVAVTSELSSRRGHLLGTAFCAVLLGSGLGLAWGPAALGSLFLAVWMISVIGWFWGGGQLLARYA